MTDELTWYNRVRELEQILAERGKREMKHILKIGALEGVNDFYKKRIAALEAERDVLKETLSQLRADYALVCEQNAKFRKED